MGAAVRRQHLCHVAHTHPNLSFMATFSFLSSHPFSCWCCSPPEVPTPDARLTEEDVEELQQIMEEDYEMGCAAPWVLLCPMIGQTLREVEGFPSTLQLYLIMGSRRVLHPLLQKHATLAEPLCISCILPATL